MRRTKTEKGQKAKKRILIESTVVFCIILAPFLLKIYELFPSDSQFTTVLGIEIGSNNWNDVSTYMWFVFQKVVPLYLMFIWFMTCKHWWYHILLIPIVMYAFQIFEDVFDNDYIVDTENLLWLLPICVVLIPFVYFIRLKLYDKHVHGIDLEAMDEELRILKEKEALRKERQKLEQRQTTLSKKM